jgi:hypothetical protein
LEPKAFADDLAVATALVRAVIHPFIELATTEIRVKLVEALDAVFQPRLPINVTGTDADARLDQVVVRELDLDPGVDAQIGRLVAAVITAAAGEE